jgi:hypothetical protein
MGHEVMDSAKNQTIFRLCATHAMQPLAARAAAINIRASDLPAIKVLSIMLRAP